MIFSAGGNIECAVELLEQYHSHKLVRKGHLRNGKPHAAGLLNFIRKPVGASDNKAYIRKALAGNAHKLFGKTFAWHLLSLNAERN